MPQIYDLFISYSSHDRPWAKRFEADIQRAYPWLQIFFDRQNILAGSDWRKKLTEAIFACKHLALFWSPSAKDSVEVLAEIGIFSVLMEQSPTVDFSQRAAFSFLLSGAPGGILTVAQGFPALAPFYDPALDDRGVSALDTVPSAMEEWKRAIRMIGDAITKTDNQIRVPVAVLATTQGQLGDLDANHGKSLIKGALSLDAYLDAYKLDWNTVRARYGLHPFKWRPYGGKETIVEILESLRVEVNSTIEAGQPLFGWEYVDLEADDVKDQNRKLARGSIIIVDPISLLDRDQAALYRRLEEDALTESSLVVSLAPVGPLKEDWLRDALVPHRFKLLNSHFTPKIPPEGTSAQWVLDVQRMSDLERLVRRRVGNSYLAVKLNEARSITGMGSR